MTARQAPIKSGTAEGTPPAMITRNSSNTYDGGNAYETSLIHSGSIESGYKTPANGDMSAGIGHMNHSDAGPKFRTSAQPKIPRAIPKRNRTSMKGIAMSPYISNDSLNNPTAMNSITTSPTMLVAMLVKTRLYIYSDIESGVANMFKKLRDHTSSKKAMVTPCIIRIKKSQKRTAPSSAGTKLKPGVATVLRYLVRKPQSIISTPTQANMGNTREKLPRIRYNWRSTIANIRLVDMCLSCPQC